LVLVYPCGNVPIDIYFFLEGGMRIELIKIFCKVF